MTIDLSPSPYDVPEAIRAYFDRTLGRFVIEFRHIQSEPWECQSEGVESVVLRLGKHSRRLYGIEMDFEQLGAGQMQIGADLSRLVVAAIGFMAERESGPNRESHLQVLRETFEQGKAQVIGELREAERLRAAG